VIHASTSGGNPQAQGVDRIIDPKTYLAGDRFEDIGGGLKDVLG
jgi:hypothetical protein